MCRRKWSLGSRTHTALLLVKGQLCRKQTPCRRFVNSVSPKVEKARLTCYPTVSSRNIKISTACRSGSDHMWTEQDGPVPLACISARHESSSAPWHILSRELSLISQQSRKLGQLCHKQRSCDSLVGPCLPQPLPAWTSSSPTVTVAKYPQP